MTSIEIIAALINKLAWIRPEIGSDTACIISMAEAKLEQEGWHQNPIDGSWQED